MSSPSTANVVADHRGPPLRRRPVASNAVLGTIIFVAAEVMFFAALISAFIIAENTARATGGWPPPGQPRLPVAETAFNTLALLASGGFLYYANRIFRSNPDEPERAEIALLGSVLLGAFFVLFQGAEWFSLIREGLTLTSGSHGSFFYMVVGTHALHAVIALGFLFGAYRALRKGTLTASRFTAVQIFWFFVVGLWPVLYWKVYL